MRQIDSVRKNQNAFEAAVKVARERIEESSPSRSEGPGPGDSGAAAEVLIGTRPLETLSVADTETAVAMEAIILDALRPPYLIVRDEIQIRGEFDHVDLIETRKQELETTARSVGRVDLFNHSTLSYAGTGWLIDSDIAVTNRHVAEVFTEKTWFGGRDFRRGAFGETMEARLDYVRQHDSPGFPNRRADVLEILYVAEPGEADVAFFRVEVRDDVEPLDLFTGRVEDDTPIAAIGYPAWDGGRNDPALMADIFDDVYDVKRFSPGLANGYQSQGLVLLGDYTSLGGNSGSPVIDLDSGKVIGLHFAGAFRDTNYAVAADIVAAASARLKTVVVVGDVLPEAPTSAPEFLGGRDGYRSNFLGDATLSVPLPDLGPWSDDIAPVSDDLDSVLKYGHFSVVQSKSRRLPLLTAVNIDGEKAIKLKRKGTWKLDGRIADAHQVGNELYRKNPLDRGHMVRRMDPGWGASRSEAQQAEIDTFHYTNSAPQHKDLNQKDWVGLEDYVLEAAETRGFKVSVFTGPVFRDSDRTLRSQPGAEDVQIPEEFWKVAVMVNDDTGVLSATGYVLSHGPMIRDLVEAAFVLGKYETYQIKIAKIEETTGLDFGDLKNFDPLGSELLEESPFAEVARRIQGSSDLTL